MTDRPIIDVRRLTKSFAEHEVLKGIDLTVAKSETVCVIGPSGSGKSTLLRCIAFLEPYSSGDVLIEGELLGFVDGANGVRKLDSERRSRRRAAMSASSSSTSISGRT